MPKLHRNLADMRREARRGNEFYRQMFAPDKPPQFAPEPEKAKRAAPVRDPRRVSEADVLKAVWKYLTHHPKVAWCTRVNSGTWQLDDRFVRFNYKRGMSDLLGQMKDGRLLAVEIKAPNGELLDHQRGFLQEVLINHGVAFVARSITDAERELA